MKKEGNSLLNVIKYIVLLHHGCRYPLTIPRLKFILAYTYGMLYISSGKVLTSCEIKVDEYSVSIRDIDEHIDTIEPLLTTTTFFDFEICLNTYFIDHLIFGIRYMDVDDEDYFFHLKRQDFYQEALDHGNVLSPKSLKSLMLQNRKLQQEEDPYYALLN